MANAPTGPEESVPAHDELMKILSSPDAPPHIILDLTNSDGDITGILHARLDRLGNLVLEEVG